LRPSDRDEPRGGTEQKSFHGIHVSPPNPHLSWPDNRTFLAGDNGKPLSTQAESVVSSRLLQECFTNWARTGVP
jgi:hypothetical protein